MSSTDAPLLHPAFVRRVVREVGDGVDACVPHVRGFRQPLAAAYRVSLAPLVQSLLAADRLRPSFLLEACRWRELDDEALLADTDVARFDPELDSVTNLERSRRLRGGEVAARARGRRRVLRRAAASRRARDESRSARQRSVPRPTRSACRSARTSWPRLNGDQISRDPDEPLVDGRPGLARQRGGRRMNAADARRTAARRRRPATSALPPAVDVGTGATTPIELPEPVLREYLGGAGLGAWLHAPPGPRGRRPASRPRRPWPSCSPRSSARRSPPAPSSPSLRSRR